MTPLAALLQRHRIKYDSLDQNIDSWYCSCNGLRQYRSQGEAEEKHLAPLIEALVSEWDYTDPTTGEFSYDRFWEEKVSWAENGDRTPTGEHCIRVNGNHFVAEPGIIRQAGFMGHGGARFRWVDLDGDDYESNNVWNQGEIPEKFRDRLPDNAEWIPGYWCGGCSEYHTNTCP